MLGKKKESVSLVLALEVGDGEILKRLLKRAEIEGRKDDTKEVIENRIQIYNNQTQPLIDFYKNKKKFQSIQGIGGIDEIFISICKIIDRQYWIEKNQ